MSGWASANSHDNGPGFYQYPYPYFHAYVNPSSPSLQSQLPRDSGPLAQNFWEGPQFAHPPQALPPRSPSPPIEYQKDWDVVIRTFLRASGLTQALRGFEADMLVMNPEWEDKTLPLALGQLLKALSHMRRRSDTQGPEPDTMPTELQPHGRALDDRKLDYSHLGSGIEPRSQSSFNKDVSNFLARNRARNDASNRTEFIQSIAEKRRRLNPSGNDNSQPVISSCARTDAKTQDRDVQMKYDIAKNEDGPLRRTLKADLDHEPKTHISSKLDKPVVDGSSPSADRYPALDERIGNIESHLSVRYVPSPPRSLLDRLKYLEDHIVHLEREYPPWAALHFNQPNRGWPPPPRPTPIIVPSHLTSTAVHGNRKDPHEMDGNTPSTHEDPSLQGVTPTTVETMEQKSAKMKSKTGRAKTSSLHRAVMERLEVKKAMHDLAGNGSEQ
ncbi:hypothetical protein WOLCODRAFT_108131 [Wolfiporia cocos MD-104 SS10]|uniref:Uncharacterized protein n=1 Tax=Wolfiporia cocos (strain MD-104) TaxID=742152 RepID=A0A2H3J244_WOLCO|nr:hypothetical protein WOLCODRAFT_108131 [Wolfiporia cocos MD-104 SS10]